VKDLQGTITVESEVGRAQFPGTASQIKIHAKAEVVRPLEIPRGTERILFVDDEEMLAEWGKMTLERLGYTVTAMTDTSQALKAFSLDPTLFDLVITDHAMPHMAGSQLALELLKIRSGMPIILCTGHSETMSAEKAKDLGIREFLMKPLNKQELAAAVRHVLDTRSGGLRS